MSQIAMHPAARSLIEAMQRLKPTPLHQMSAPDAREAFNQRHARAVLPAKTRVRSEDRMVDAAYPVPVRVYHPPQRRPGTLVYFHGGGWVVGTLDMVDALCHDLCLQSGMQVVSVDYRLAPEHPFPAALVDGLGVLTALQEGALGFEAGSLFVAGDSAGGNIAAVLALKSAAEGRALAGQILIYPVTDVSRAHPSMERFATGLNLDAATMAWFTESYQPDRARWTDPDLSPLLSPLSLTPCPALVVTAGYDPLHDEGAAYAQHLAEAGVPTQYVDFPSQIHGFASQTALSDDPYLLRDLIAGFLRRHCQSEAP